MLRRWFSCWLAIAPVPVRKLAVTYKSRKILLKPRNKSEYDVQKLSFPPPLCFLS